LSALNTEAVSNGTMVAFIPLPECCLYKETENSIVIAMRSIDLSHISAKLFDVVQVINLEIGL
jgi:hypothetical protein